MRKLTHEEFEKRLAETHPQLEAVSLYQSNKKPIVVFCKNCGGLWITRPAYLLNHPGGCKYCSGNGTSFPEMFILEAFRFSFGEDKVKHRDTKAIGRELDIYVPERKFAVEPGAWVFHKKKQDADEKKAAACREAGIKLATVYFNVPQDEIPLREDVIAANDRQWSKEGRREFTALVERLLSDAGAERVPRDDEEWEEIRQKAIEGCGSSGKDYLAMASEAAPNTEILDKVVFRQQAVKARCKKCGHEWDTTVNSIIDGNQCAKCAGIKKLTHEEYVEQVAETHPEITILGEYTGANKKIEACCDKGHVFEKRAYHLRRDGCPVCGVEKAANAGREHLAAMAEKKRERNAA